MSVNKVMLVGQCGTDPQVRSTVDGTAVANLRLATQGPHDKQAEWHSLVFFGGKAELVGKSARKGKLLYVEGKLRNNNYTSANGIEYRTSEVHVSDFRFLDKRPSD
jgi:single-strand DNA-binding protein